MRINETRDILLRQRAELELIKKVQKVEPVSKKFKNSEEEENQKKNSDQRFRNIYEEKRRR